jgi:hypothetical protein
LTASIDSKNKLAVDYDVVNIASDRNQLSPMAKSAMEMILQVERIDATADRGSTIPWTSRNAWTTE